MISINLNIFIVIVTVIVSFMAFNNLELLNRFKFNAYLIKHRKEGWRFLSYGLVHAGWGHLLINMFVLYGFGDDVESEFVSEFGNQGYLYYLLLYVGGISFSTLHDFIKQKDNPYYSAVGASGAVSAVLFAAILIEPAQSLIVFPLPIPIPSWLFGILYLVYSAYMGKRGQDNIGHNAHFYGAIFGVLFTVIALPDVITEFFSKLF